MKFTLLKEQLLTPLQQVVNVIEKRQTMPILANVLINATEQQLVLTGTDLEIQLVAKINLEGIEPGAITVPARKFLDICRLLPNGSEIKVEQHEDKIKISSGRSRFSLTTLPAEHYPEFSESAMEQQFQINTGQMKKALDKTLFCMASQDVRFYLNGLLLHLSNSHLELVASDGHRLAVYEDNIEQATGYEARIIIPRKGMQELSRLLDDSETTLDVQFSNNNIRVAYKNLLFSAKLIDAKYPDFSKVFSQPFLSPILLPRLALRDAVNRVAILSNEKYKGVSMDIADNTMKLNAHNPENDEAEDELAIEFTGEPLDIAFNAQYLLDAISNLDSEQASLAISQNSSCCVIQEPGEPRFRFVVMPMRL